MDDPVRLPDLKPGSLTRRTALRLLAAAPAAAAIGASAASAAQGEAGAAAEEPARPSSPSPYAKFIAKHEEGLTRKERSQLRKQAPGLEGALVRLRDFPLADDVEPALYFRALPPRRRGDR